jgi:hypothetical protein
MNAALQKRYALVVVLCGLLITGLIGLLVVGAVVYAALFQGKVPEILGNWGGVLIGFFVGQFFNFAQSFLAPNVDSAAASVRPSGGTSQ